MCSVKISTNSDFKFLDITKSNSLWRENTILVENYTLNSPESFLKPVSMPNVIENFPLKTDVPSGCG